MNKYCIYGLGDEGALYLLCKQRIMDAVANGQQGKAQRIVLEWMAEIGEQLSLPRTQIWKVFKKELAARWFGKREYKRFSPGWSLDDALAYARRFTGEVRLTLLLRDIAVNARSIALPSDRQNDWRDILAQIDNSIEMEMFPESSNANTICFRRYTTQLGETIIYEAGTGQAMFVFEQEQGKHPVILATKHEKEDFVFTRSLPSENFYTAAEEIETKLKHLIQTHDITLSSKCFGLCRKLGIEQISIEGYFDPTNPDKVVIVDLDLPFDFVFMLPNSH